MQNEGAYELVTARAFLKAFKKVCEAAEPMNSRSYDRLGAALSGDFRILVNAWLKGARIASWELIAAREAAIREIAKGKYKRGSQNDCGLIMKGD